MKIEDRPIDKVTPYDKNPRKNDHAVTKVAESIPPRDQPATTHDAA